MLFISVVYDFLLFFISQRIFFLNRMTLLADSQLYILPKYELETFACEMN